MIRRKKSALNIALVTLALCNIPMNLLGVDCAKCHDEPPKRSYFKSSGFTEKAVGVMDKGQLQNNTSNIGDLSSFHLWFTNAGHWPRTADYDRQYVFGLGLVVAVNEHNVIETVTQGLSKVTDWLPPNDAAGRHYSGEIRAESDDTPFQASSDFRETWPFGYYDINGSWTSTDDRYWPGYFRVDVGNVNEDTLNLHPDSRLLPDRENEFTSDRDLFCIYNDDENAQGTIGIEVEQSSYSYGRPYAEDFIFWDLKIHNNSGGDLDSIYIGFYSKFRPDYDNHDYVNIIDSDSDGKLDFVYVYDLNNTLNKTWANEDDPLGIVGLRIFDTPYNLGVTDFHHFARGVSPVTDEEMWALTTSTKNDDVLDSLSWYFHGNNRRIDYTGLDSLESFYPSWLDDESGVELAGDGINFIISSGPHSIKTDSSVSVSLGLIMGDAGEVPDSPDTTDLMNNLRTANKMYNLYFQGSGPPDPPTVTAIPGDEKATLFWNSEPSESSVDVLKEVKDFEGYKIFRSTDRGQTWGEPVTDAYGIQVGWVPIATFDYSFHEDTSRYGVDVSGLDPLFPQFLGTNSGLVHTFTDDNLINGLEYWYCVTAYDRGSQIPDSLEQSYLYPIGSSIFEPHTVSVIPSSKAKNFADAVVPTGRLEPHGGVCNGIVKIEMADQTQITGHGYKVTFSDSAQYIEGEDTTFGMGFTLVDTTDMDTLYNNYIFSDQSGDNLPIVDGFRITVQNTPLGIKEFGWTKVQHDTSTFDWRYKSINPDLGGQLIQEDISSYDDWRITVNYDGGDSVRWTDVFTGSEQVNKQYLPLRIEIISDSENPRDVTHSSWLGEFAILAPEDYRKDYYSPLGWDLEPGGKGYTPASIGWYEKHVDILILEAIDLDPSTGDTLTNYLLLFTNNKPDSSYNKDNELEIIHAKAPSDGDEFTIRTYKPFREEIYYTFGTTAMTEGSPADSNSLKNMRVVPDPYIVTNIWESSEFGKKLMFNNLPDQCTIKIYSLVGDLISTVKHDAPNNHEFWNMRTKNDQFIAPGVYLFYAEAPNGDEKTGRFLVIK